jgi:competence protein ComEA
MYVSWRRTAVVVALTLIPWVAGAAEKPERTTTVSTPAGADAKVNINSADVKELMTLNGVGQKVADRIVAYREAHGPFKKAEEVRKVEGIGQGLWERNRQRIVIK